MRRLYVLAFALAVLAGCASTPMSSGAQAKIGSGQWLHNLWGAYQRVGANTATVADGGDMQQYMGFVEGAAETMADAQWLDLASITYGQQFAVVGKYLDDHPEQWNHSAQSLVYRALYAVWPGTKAAPYR